MPDTGDMEQTIYTRDLFFGRPASRRSILALLRSALLAAGLLALAGGWLAAQEEEGPGPGFDLPGAVQPDLEYNGPPPPEDLALIARVLGTTPAKLQARKDGRRELATGLPALPRASSVLKDDGHGPYTASQANDGDTAGSWVEGVKGPGSGEWLAVSRTWCGNIISIYPGYGGKEWSKNNRLKTGKVLVFGLSIGVRTVLVDQDIYSCEFSLPDAQDWASIMIHPQLEPADLYVAVLVIDTVYPGSKYDDTCVASFGLDMSQ